MTPLDWSRWMQNHDLAGLLGGATPPQNRMTIPRFVNDGGTSGEWVPQRPGGLLPPPAGGGAVAVPPSNGGWTGVSHGLPSGLGSSSAGIFDQYMRDNMANNGPTFMPPSFSSPTGSGAGTGGGGGGGGYGGSDGNGVGTSADTTGSNLGGLGFSISPSVAQNVLGGLFGPLGALGGYLGLSRGLSDLTASLNNPNYSNEGRNSLGYTSSDIGAGPGGADGQTGDVGSSDAGSTGAGSDTGSDAGQGGDGTGSGGQLSKGGRVTAGLLGGPNPKGPDDGYASLDVGELVVPKKVAKKLNKRQVAGLLGR